jgi:hypothetical protein
METPAPIPRAYLIVNPAGLYYTGTVREPWADNFTPTPSLAFAYSFESACREILAFPVAFAGCVPELAPAPASN